MIRCWWQLFSKTVHQCIVVFNTIQLLQCKTYLQFFWAITSQAVRWLSPLTMRFRELIKPVTGGSGPLIQHLFKTCHFCILAFCKVMQKVRWGGKIKHFWLLSFLLTFLPKLSQLVILVRVIASHVCELFWDTVYVAEEVQCSYLLCYKNKVDLAFAYWYRFWTAS